MHDPCEGSRWYTVSPFQLCHCFRSSVRVINSYGQPKSPILSSSTKTAFRSDGVVSQTFVDGRGHRAIGSGSDWNPRNIATPHSAKDNGLIDGGILPGCMSHAIALHHIDPANPESAFIEGFNLLLDQKFWMPTVRDALS